MAKKPKAVVLGVGAERGVGAGLSRRFAKEGYHVLVAGRTAARIEKVAETVRADGGSATAVVTDGTKEADVIALFDLALADEQLCYSVGRYASIAQRTSQTHHRTSTYWPVPSLVLITSTALLQELGVPSLLWRNVPSVNAADGPT